MPLTEQEHESISAAVKDRREKAIKSLLRTIRKHDSTGREAAKIALQHRRYLRELEKLNLIRYWNGYWFTTVQGREVLEEMDQS